MTTHALEVRDLQHTYGDGAAAVRALAGVDLAFAAGTFTAVMGPSGSGKSTFLTCAAGLERPTEGRVLVDGPGPHRLERGRPDPVPPRADRLRLPGLPPDALPHRRAERRPARPARRPAAATGTQVRALLDRVGLGRPRRAPAERALRRPAAAGRHRPRAGHRPGRRARRRADRRAGLRHRARGARPAAPERRRPRPDRRDGHPRPGRGVVRRPRWSSSSTAGSPAAWRSRPPTRSPARWRTSTSWSWGRRHDPARARLAAAPHAPPRWRPSSPSCSARR